MKGHYADHFTKLMVELQEAGVGADPKLESLLHRAADNIGLMMGVIDELKDDTAILDFMQAHPERRLSCHHSGRKGWTFAGFTNYEYTTFPTLREAVVYSMRRWP